MPITFVPQRRQILICDFEYGRIDPSIGKVRRALIVSPRSYNQRHGNGPGRCVVVPLSATPPNPMNASCVEFKAGIYQSLSADVWAICECIRSASHDRLDRVAVSGKYLSEMISEEDMARVAVGIRHATGLA